MCDSIEEKNMSAHSSAVINANEVSAKNTFHNLFNEIEIAVATEKIETLRKISKLISASLKETEWIKNLKLYYEDDNNPLKGTNLVILACKNERLGVLNFLFNDDKEALYSLPALAGRKEPKPDDKDTHNHKAIYYAIRSNNTNILNFLVENWPGEYLKNEPDMMEETLSKSFQEIQLKNIPLSEEMNFSVHNILLKLRFFQNENYNSKSSLKSIQDRIGLVTECIDKLITDYKVNDADDIFLYILTFIVQNIFILKRLLRSTYDSLPWEEIEFCLIVFLNFLKPHNFDSSMESIADTFKGAPFSSFAHEENKAHKQFSTFKDRNCVFTNCVLTKSKILNYLEHFSSSLKKVIDISKSTQFHVFPKSRRPENITRIIETLPFFQELYEDYARIRDIYSLELVKQYLDVAISVDSELEDGQIVIMRSLQVLGENVKNTIESPNLSDSASNVLLYSLSKTTSSIVKDIRDDLSHDKALQKRGDLGKSDKEFFANVQNDLKKLNSVSTDILRKLKINLIKQTLMKISETNSLDDFKEIDQAFRIGNPHNILKQNFDSPEMNSLKILLSEFSETIGQKTYEENLLFESLYDMEDIKDFNSNYEISNNSAGHSLYLYYSSTVKTTRMDENDLELIKKSAKTESKALVAKVSDINLMKIAKTIASIYNSASLRVNEEKLHGLKLLYYKILNNINSEIGAVKWIEEIRDVLRGVEYKKKRKKICKDFASSKNDIAIYEAELGKKLDMLTKLLTRFNLKLKNNENISINDEFSFETYIIIEMIMLDIMSIFNSSSKFSDNSLYFDSYYPTLAGKNLRNHIAHNNVLNNVLFDPITSLILNAMTFSSEDIKKWNKKLDKVVNDDLVQVKFKFKEHLKILKNQKRMYHSLEENDKDLLKACINDGADLRSRDINMWTAEHFACKAPDSDVMEFLLKQDFSSFQRNIKQKDSFGRIPLHVAAEVGNKSVVEFLLEHSNSCIEITDISGKTSLHIAAQAGNLEVVQVLLNNNANFRLKDVRSFAPLHYAITHNHINVAIILLKKDKTVDDNKIDGDVRPLCIAAEKGCIQIVKYLLQKGADVNAKTDKRDIPLHYAARHLEVIKMLILQRSEINCQNISGSTPLYNAVVMGHDNCVNFLLEKGANVDIPDILRNTPLHAAANLGFLNITQALLRYGASINSLNHSGLTPLHFASAGGHLEVTKYLIRRRANVNICDSEGQNPLHMSAKFRHSKIAQVLIENGSDFTITDIFGLSPFLMASAFGDEKTVRILLEKECNLADKDKEGLTALHHSCINEHLQIIRMLVEHRIDVNVKNNNLQTPLHISAKIGNYEIVKILMENGGNCESKDCAGIAPLHYGARCENFKILKIMITKGVDINIIDNNRRTPLHYSVDANNINSTKILIQNNCEINAIDNKGMTALGVAVKNHYKEMIKFLIENGSDPYVNNCSTLSIAINQGYRSIFEVLVPPKDFNNVILFEDNASLLHKAAEVDQRSILKYIISNGVDINGTTKSENLTPLHVASERGYYEIVKMLVNHGANLNRKSVKGDDALHMAIKRKYFKIAEFLLSRGANYESPDCDGQTPVELAVANNSLNLVKCLVESKHEDVNKKFPNDKSLLHIAAEHGCFEITKYLIKKGADMDLCNKESLKPIQISVIKGSQEILKLLLEKFSVDCTNDNQSSLLHLAAAEGQNEIAKYLIDKKANVNAVDALGLTPLHTAAMKGHLKILKLLMKNGSLYNIKDKSNQKPIDLARRDDVILVLKSTDELFQAVKENKLLTVKDCIHKKAIVNSKNLHNVSPLTYATTLGFTDIVKVLLESKANPNNFGNKRNTPLHFASKLGYFPIVKHLLANGAIYDAKSDTGKIPLEFARNTEINRLLKLIDTCFKEVEMKNDKLIKEIENVKDTHTLVSIINCCNENNETLVMRAIRNHFPKMKLLKNVLCNLAFKNTIYFKLFMNYLSENKITIESFYEKNSSKITCFQQLCLETLMKIEKYDFALQTFRDLSNIYEKEFGINNIIPLTVKSYISKILYAQYKYQETLELLYELYHTQTCILGKLSEDALVTRSFIALVLYRIGKNEEAIKICEDVYKNQLKLLGESNISVLETEVNMASILDALGKHDDALELNNKNYKKCKSLLGSRNEFTLISLNNIGAILLNKGDINNAIPVFKKVIRARKKVFGVNHSKTLKVQRKLALCLSDQREFDELPKLYDHILTQQAQSLGLDNLETICTYIDLADLNINMGNRIEALKLFAKNFLKIIKILGPEHYETKYVQSRINMIYARFEQEGAEGVSIFSHVLWETICDELQLGHSLRNRIKDEMKKYLTSVKLELVEGGASMSDMQDNLRPNRIFEMLYKHFIQLFNVRLGSFDKD